ncbi:TIGR03808 family TAT-translocated repetitive protein [Tianweitania sp. BSSL-BM11]|uniref:TIGR03808 family TAT-translocated repetitive protein n=1 Tax=Tianweitania aestuarii TaxID=2814886 RepID=A0ABS5RS10_9HYPH|nr:TIGR03808 family TAT-translocated repetitive protein [Tianweitania aestuarii]MBS9719843.1 TIGR03808 family TAT-translocated repetitive protein [Tianweitania aestuarii]
MLNRRHLLASGLASLPLLAGASTARAQTRAGLQPNAPTDQSAALQRLIDQASERNEPVVLPPGRFIAANLTLPRRLRLIGIPRATRLIYGGGGHLLFGSDLDHVELSGITFDGAGLWLGDDIKALLDFRRPGTLFIDRCEILNSAKTGLALEGAAGRVERSAINNATEYALYSVQARGLTIADNTVADCGDGGILVHRWEPGEDGTIVANNRVDRIGAKSGGTGQFGNGINLYRAHTVSVTNNKVADCAFSAIRANSASNALITGNSCLRSGETGLYVEFAFEGAVIGNNIVDGAANGISVVNFNFGGRMATVSGNIVRNLSTTGPYPADPPGFGIGIAVEADTAVTGNVIENAPLFGINIGWGEFMRNVTATGNTIREAGIGISVSVVDGTGSAVIADNVLSQTRNGAIIGHRWTERATDDLATASDQPFANLTIADTQVN